MTTPFEVRAHALLVWVGDKLRWLIDLLHGEFESAFGLHASTARLSAVTTGFPIFTRQRVATEEASERVVLLQTSQSFKNGFAPCFDGEFREVAG